MQPHPLYATSWRQYGGNFKMEQASPLRRGRRSLSKLSGHIYTTRTTVLFNCILNNIFYYLSPPQNVINHYSMMQIILFFILTIFTERKFMVMNYYWCSLIIYTRTKKVIQKKVKLQIFNHHTQKRKRERYRVRKY